MKTVFPHFYNFLTGRSYVLQVMIFYLATFLIVVISIPLQVLAVAVAGNTDAGPNTNELFMVLIVAPILETLVFQHWVFKILEKLKWGEQEYFWIIVISAMFFGLSHFYSLRYIVVAVSEGLVLAYTYYYYHKNTAKAFRTTTFVHFLHNGTVSLILYATHNSN